MSRHHSHLNTAKTILANYNGQIPFAQEIKKFFAGQKKYGSKDRRQIKSLCYSYFRIAQALQSDLTIDEKLIQAYFICNSNLSAFIDELRPQWAPLVSLSIEDKCIQLGIHYENLFPHLNNLEAAIDKSQFSLAHLKQPDLFLRIRPNYEQKVKHKLDKAQIDYTFLDSHCVALSNATKIEEELIINKEVVIQDYASQQVGRMFDLVKVHIPTSANALKVWDCCAASGGKAILAFDKLGVIDATLSDIRNSMLHNLSKRLKEAGIVGYRSQQIDLTDETTWANFEAFDLIIADVPCSGSGTWSRTPERLLNFGENEIEHYSKLQKNITGNIQTKLKPGALLLYITCSVFKQENTEIVNHLINSFGLQLIQSEIYSGYQFNANSMYAALLRKPMK